MGTPLDMFAVPDEMSSVGDLAEAFINAVRCKKQAAKELKDAESAVEKAENALLKAMENEGKQGMEGIKVGGTTLFIKRDVFVSCDVEGPHFPEADKWLKDNNLEWVKKMTINGKTLTSQIRMLREELDPDGEQQLIEELTDSGFSVRDRNRIGYRNLK